VYNAIPLEMDPALRQHKAEVFRAHQLRAAAATTAADARAADELRALNKRLAAALEDRELFTHCEDCVSNMYFRAPPEMLPFPVVIGGYVDSEMPILYAGPAAFARLHQVESYYLADSPLGVLVQGSLHKLVALYGASIRLDATLEPMAILVPLRLADKRWAQVGASVLLQQLSPTRGVLTKATEIVLSPQSGFEAAVARRGFVPGSEAAIHWLQEVFHAMLIGGYPIWNEGDSFRLDDQVMTVERMYAGVLRRRTSTLISYTFVEYSNLGVDVVERFVEADEDEDIAARMRSLAKELAIPRAVLVLMFRCMSGAAISRFLYDADKDADKAFQELRARFKHPCVAGDYMERLSE